MARELIFERQRPKLAEYLRAYIVYDDVTGAVTAIETDRQGMANYDVDVRIIRAGRPDVSDRSRGGRPAINLRTLGLLVTDSPTGRPGKKQRVGWDVKVRMTTPDEFRRKQGLQRG